MTKTSRVHTIGGQLKTRIALRIFGENVDPDRVAMAIGRAATQAYRKGDRVGQRSTAVRPKGMCIYEFKGHNVHGQILELLAMLPDVRSWCELVEGNVADVYCAADLEGDVAGLVIEPELLIQLGERGLALNIEVYSADDLSDV